MLPGTISSLIEALTTIWKRVLRRESIALDDNFFEIGGDPWIAIELFREIARVTNRDLAPIMIYAAPTVGKLAAVLESSAAPRFPACVLLKEGTPEIPAFFLHGLGGNIMEFFQLLKHVQAPQAIYGLQARGTDGLEEPCSQIEEMARFHVNEIRVLQPHGPYLLVGYSLGGLIALEMARRLAENGESTALLVMIDSYPSLRFAPLTQRLGTYARRARHYARRKLKPPGSANVLPSLVTAFTPAMQRVQECSARALQEFHPRRYRGRIQFIRAGAPLYFPANPAKVWASFTDQFEFETVPGDHQELLTTHSESLAAVISRHLNDFSIKQPTGSTHP